MGERHHGRFQNPSQPLTSRLLLKAKINLNRRLSRIFQKRIRFVLPGRCLRGTPVTERPWNHSRLMRNLQSSPYKSEWKRFDPTVRTLSGEIRTNFSFLSVPQFLTRSLLHTATATEKQPQPQKRNRHNGGHDPLTSRDPSCVTPRISTVFGRTHSGSYAHVLSIRANEVSAVHRARPEGALGLFHPCFWSGGSRSEAVGRARKPPGEKDG